MITWLFGCSTRQFIITADPNGAYIVGHGETTHDKPLNEKVFFFGKSDQHSFIAIKRGYHPDTISVSKDSPADLSFNLVPTGNVSTLALDPVELRLDNVYLLPVSVEILLHKGIGNMDRYEASEELSAIAFSELNQELQLIQSDTTISFHHIGEDSRWKFIAAQLETYLKTLDPALLDYYPEPPSVAALLQKEKALLSPLIARIMQSGRQEYLAFAWTRSVKTTTGRLIGNAGLATASAAVTGYETAAYGYPVTLSDPSAFVSDNSTIFVAYIIDPATGEVVEIRQYVVPYDITKKERLQMLARSIIQFPKEE
jgi:hypothetical protein